MRALGSAAVLAAALALLAGDASYGRAQEVGADLADAVAGVDGEVTFHFKGRDGIEGCGDGGLSFGERGHVRWTGERDRSRCGPGPVQVRMDVVDGRPRDLDVRVGPEAHLERGRDLDLGRVSTAEAAGYLLALAETARSGVAEDAIVGAFAADSVTVWPRLVALARDRSRPDEVRSSAIFWIGQEAAGVGTDDLAGLASDEDEDREVRDAAVFALSQRPSEEGVPVLMELARSADDAHTRRTAMFWLAQSDDPGVVDFFERVLTDRGSRR